MSEHELWNELGNLYFMSGAYNQAAHAYERSIQSKTSFGRPYSNLALTFVQQGKYDEAIDLYRRSIELLTNDQEKAISWNRLGSVYRHLKDYSKAVIAFQEADELDPASADDFPAENPARRQAPPVPSSVLDEPATQITETATPEAPAEAVSGAESPQACEAVADLTVTEIVEEPATEIEVPEEPVADIVVEPVVLLPEEAIAAVDVAPIALISEETIAEQPEPGVTELRDDLIINQVEQEQPEVVQWFEEPVAEQAGPELEWWDVDEQRVQSATQSPEAILAAAADPNTSWTPADLSQFQQDVSQVPQASALSAWGEPDFEEDFELWSPVDPETDVQGPDPDGDNISRWLPLPEEEPMNLDELYVPPFVDELEAESEPSSEWSEPDEYRSMGSTEFIPLPATSLAMPTSVDSIQDRQSAWDAPEVHVDVDVDVQERPAPDFAVAAQELTVSNATETVACAAQPELVQASTSEVAPLPEELAPDRDEEEMREIEMGIAKFRRVVQLNPRNAHAWDALGTLFKSAGLYKDAILAYQQAIANDPSKSLYYHHLGLVYACEGRDEDAIGAFQRVIEIDPEYSLAHATLGGYYRKLGLEELAQKHIGKAMKNIFDSENEYNRACLEAICGNTDHAIELLNVALKNKQTYVDWILRDPDLDFIRQDPRFKQLISDYTR